MGTWGPGLYQNDVSEDVKHFFRDQLRRGRSSEQITFELMAQFSDSLTDPGERNDFWFALADTQWEMGRLLPEVKENALACILQGDDLARWENASAKERSKRKEVLHKLQIKLNTPQPQEKKVTQYRLYKCPWKIGDVFSFCMESDAARNAGLYGRHLLIEKVDEKEWHPGHLIPVVYVKLTEDTTLPATVEEYNRLPFVQIYSLPNEFRFFPLDGENFEGDIAEKSKMPYETDEYGFLPVYRVGLITTSKRVIPDKLVYLGNFQNSAPPPKEFVHQCKLNISTVFWKEFEENMIARYLGYNLRQNNIYHPNAEKDSNSPFS